MKQSAILSMTGKATNGLESWKLSRPSAGRGIPGAGSRDSSFFLLGPIPAVRCHKAGMDREGFYLFQVSIVAYKSYI